MKKSSRNLGFTLLELLVTLAVLAILVSLAVPNMSDTTKRNAVKAASRNYLGGLSFGRNEALSRGRTITMCPSVDGEVCDGTGFDWSNGFIIFVDNGAGTNSGNGVKNTDEEILLAHNNSPNTVIEVTNPTAPAPSDLEFLSWNYQGYLLGKLSSGDISEIKAKVVVCHESLEQRYARGLFVEFSGRVMSSRDSEADDDIFHEDVFGTGSVTEGFPNLTCG